MVKERKVGWTTIALPIHVKKRLEQYALPRETWQETFERLLQEVNDYRIIKERYRLK